MSLADEIEDLLGEARMRDVRRHQAKVPSDAQIARAFKDASKELGSLSGKLSMAGHKDLASRVDDLAGQILNVKKHAGV